MRLVYEVAAGLVTQKPQGGQLSPIDVWLLWGMQRLLGDILWHVVKVMVPSMILSELVRRFI